MPYFFTTRVKYDSDSGVKQAEREKESYVGKPLAKLCSFDSVNETDTMPTEENKYKKELSGGTPCKIPVVVFSCAAFFGLPNEAKRG